jgi:hypothetical protein
MERRTVLLLILSFAAGGIIHGTLTKPALGMALRAPQAAFSSPLGQWKSLIQDWEDREDNRQPWGSEENDDDGQSEDDDGA